MTPAEPTREHAWLQKLVGIWESEMDCDMGPGQPPMKSKGIESVRSIGGLWTIGEGEGEMPGGGMARTVMTLGYDPKKKRFVGTFIASMMTHMWTYEGTIEDDTLTLDTIGPVFDPETGDTGRMTKYQDIISFKSDSHRTLTSRILGDDGQWRQFMSADYRRK
jgi:hypothetical protein